MRRLLARNKLLRAHLNMIHFDDTQESATIGGKARGLFRLKELGFNVPPFFVIDANTDINSPEFKNSLAAYSQKLGGELFSVRSSGSIEDGDGASFAGQFRTELNVSTKDLYAAVKRVATSMQEGNAKDYADNIGTTLSGGMAIVVQRQIVAERSGVLFTSSPFSRYETIIESVVGCGEKLVSGAVAPDRRIYKKNSNEAVDGLDGELLRAAESIEKTEGKPMDVEFCYDGTLWFLQLRPQTVLSVDVGSNETEWKLYVYRNFCPLCHSVQARAALPKNQQNLFGFATPIIEGLLVAGREFYTDRNGRESSKTWSTLDKPGFFEDFAQNIRACVKMTKRHCSSILKTNYRKYSDKSLFNALRKELRRYTESYIPMMMRPDDYLQDQLVAAIGKHDAQALITALTATVDQTLYAKERESFLSAIVQNDAQGYINRFGWINNPLALDFRQITTNDFYLRAEGIDASAALAALRKTKRSEKREARKTIDKFVLNKHAARLCELLCEFIFLRTYTAENSDRYFYSIRTQIIREIARRKNIDERTLLLLDYDELTALDRSPLPTPSELRLRTSGETIIFENGTYRTVFGAQAYALLGRLLKLSPPPDGVFHGDIACGGEVVAAVQVVSNFSDAQAAKRSSIIVTSMTTPEISAALESAVGIITDEGGITCHAAIVAREYGVPCLVGTRVATQVLKSGMKVKLDCITGYFEILEE